MLRLWVIIKLSYSSLGFLLNEWNPGVIVTCIKIYICFFLNNY